MHVIVWCGNNGLLQAYGQDALDTNFAELDCFYFYPPTLFEGMSPSLSLFSLVSLFLKGREEKDTSKAVHARWEMDSSLDLLLLSAPSMRIVLCRHLPCPFAFALSTWLHRLQTTL